MATRPLIKESLTVLNGNGVNPYTRNAFSNLRFAFSVLIILGFCFNFLLDLIFNWRGLISMEGIAVFTGFFQVLIKLCVLAVKRTNFADVINKMNQFWPINKYGDDLQNEIENLIMFSRKTMKVMICFLIVAALVFLIAAVTVPKRKLPFSTYYPIDLNQTFDYVVMFAFEILLVIFAALCALGFNFLFVSLIMNITCELKMIKMGIRKIPIDFEIQGDTQASLEEIYEIVEHHNLILECIKLVREIYSLLLLYIYFINMIEMSLGMVAMIATGFPPSLSNFSQFGIVTLFFLLELFFYCIVGQHLITESLSVAATVYETDWWIKTQPNLRRALVLIIQRANKTENLTAGGMFAVNLPGFRKVTRSALSFFTLVNALYRDI